MNTSPPESRLRLPPSWHGTHTIFIQRLVQAGEDADSIAILFETEYPDVGREIARQGGRLVDIIRGLLARQLWGSERQRVWSVEDPKSYNGSRMLAFLHIVFSGCAQTRAYVWWLSQGKHRTFLPPTLLLNLPLLGSGTETCNNKTILLHNTTSTSSLPCMLDNNKLTLVAEYGRRGIQYPRFWMLVSCTNQRIQ